MATGRFIDVNIRHRLCGLLLGLALALPGAAATAKPDCSRPLGLALHEHGLLYSSDTDAGIDKDIADELARRSGCKIIITLLPRARIWQLIENGALDFSLSGITNADRDRFAAFAWYFSNKYYLLVRKDAGVDRPEAFAANPKLRLGVIRSFRYSANANAFVDKLNEDGRVVYATGLGPLYELLLAGRIQAMIVEPFDTPALQSAVIGDTARITEFGDPAVPHGLIMSKVALNEEERSRWRALVDEMRADGTVERIFAKYFPSDLAREMTHF
jgi:polar amino acid transport system substrate-binding protein